MRPVGLFVGLATLDVVQRVDRLPAPNEKTIAAQSWISAGGPAAIAALTFAALGGRARLWTALGHSGAARLVAEDLAAAKVEVVDSAPPDFQLAVSTVILDLRTGERAVVSGSGHVPRLAEKIAVPDLSGVSVLMVDGHHPSLARTAVYGCAGSAEGSQPPVVVDAGSAKPVFDDLLPVATDVICSADYVDSAGRTPRELLDLGPELVAVSHGGLPLQWWTATGSGEVVPESVEALDTLGAGDVLHGAYCFGLASGMSRASALRQAVAVATERVRHLGPFGWRKVLAAL